MWRSWFVARRGVGRRWWQVREAVGRWVVGVHRFGRGRWLEEGGLGRGPKL